MRIYARSARGLSVTVWGKVVRYGGSSTFKVIETIVLIERDFLLVFLCTV